MKSEFHDPKDSPGFVLWQVTNIWQREIRSVLVDVDLTHPQFVLMALCQWLHEGAGHTDITQVQLAQYAQMDVNVTSQVLRTLERKGLLSRKPHHTDTRANAISLTAEGIQLVEKAMGIVEKADRQFFSKIEGSQSEMLGLLRRLAGKSYI